MHLPPIRMLVADASDAAQSFFKDVTERSRMGIDMTAARTGPECLAHLSEGRFNLAFIDVNMPEMSGMEAVSRARFKGNKTFITLMSGKADQGRFAVARQIRAYEYLVKPFPFATTPRMDLVDVELMYRNYLFGGQPGSGKTFALRDLVLAADRGHLRDRGKPVVPECVGR